MIANDDRDGAQARLAAINAKAELVRVSDGAAGVALLTPERSASPAIASCLYRCAPETPIARLALLGNDFSFEPYGLVIRRDDPISGWRQPRAGRDLRSATSTAFLSLARRARQPGPLLHSMFYLNTLQMMRASTRLPFLLCVAPAVA